MADNLKRNSTIQGQKRDKYSANGGICAHQKVILYSTGCPQCRVLTTKLDAKQIIYDVVTDKDYMLSMGITAVPQLSVDGMMMSFKDAVTWVNQQ